MASAQDILECVRLLSVCVCGFVCQMLNNFILSYHDFLDSKSARIVIAS